MKFVCDNCKAKYQIGDDKVAGKTVRMKCRKCGYNIKVTPGGVAEAAGVDAPPHEVEAPASVAGDALVAPPPRAPAPAPSAPSAARPEWTEGDEESTSIMNMPVRDAVAAAMGRAPGHLAPPAPRPATPRPVTTAAPHPPRPVTAPPRPYSPPSRTVAGIGGRHDAPPPPPRPVTRTSSTMAAVHHEPTPQPGAHSPVPEVEWYVGIGGTPIGPVRVSVIRERAAAHEVDGESLVWREGLSEWRPLRTVPELLEVIAAAQALVPAPAPTPAPLAAVPARAPTPTPLAAVAALAPLAAPSSSPSPVAPTPAPVAAAPVAAAPVAAAPVAAAPVAVAPVAAAPAPLVAGDPFAPIAPFGAGPLATPSNGKVNGLHHANGLDAAMHAPAPVAEPAKAPVGLDAPAAVSAPKPSTVDVDPDLERKLVPRPRNTHPMAYAFIAAVAVFSGVAAYVLLVKPPQEKIVYLPTPGASVGAAPSSTATADDKAPPQVEVGDPTTVGSGRPVARLGGPLPKASTAPTSTATAAPIDTSGFVSPVHGPEATGPSGPSNAGGTLSAGEIQGVVAQNQAMVKRKCWLPALEARSANAPMTARVSGSITIGASGAVESASASGAEKDYPGLSSCIASRMKNWKFPPAGGSQQVNVPFSFFGQ